MRSSPPGYRLLSLLVVLLAAGSLVAGVLLWPGRTPVRSSNAGQRDPTKVVDATLTKVLTVPCQPDEQVPEDAVCKSLEARRADNGRVVKLRAVDWTGDLLRTGRGVRLSVLEQPGQPPYYGLRDVGRERPMLLLLALFVGVVVAFGRWQGVRSLVALGISAAVLVGFIVPAILAGRSPVPVALVGAMAIMLIALYLSHGPGPKTTAAAAGTALALLLTAAISALFVSLTSLTGLAGEEAQGVSFELGGVSMRGLLLAGVIVGGLGVLDDVTVSQASLVFELFRANPAQRGAELTRAALRVGRDHVAATVNTIFLAYAGAALPLLVLFFVVKQPLGTVVTSEVVAVEVVRSLCGSLGLIAAVPLTTLLAVALVRADGAELAEAAVAGDGHAHQPRGAPAATASRPPEELPGGRVPYQLAGGLGVGGTRTVWLLALQQFGPALSHATVVAPDAITQASLAGLPRDVQQAAAEVARLLDVEAEAGGWYRRGERGSLRLDLREPTHLELLRRYGPYAAGTQVFARGQAAPVLGTIAHERGAPRVVLQLDAGEVER
ncbi:MAG TPA: YibE/F family protein, partial [Actinomycetes bacterium]